VIRLVGECVDARDAAVGLADQVGLFLAQSRTGPRQEGRKVFLELYGPFKTVGGDSYTTDLLALAGGMNVAAETRGTVVFLAERLVRADPDVILFVGEDSGAAAIASRSGLASLRAVRQGHVAAVHPAWLVAGPSMPRSVERIRGAIFPQQDER
jgi:iron complex transport system substrate-binding protein